MKGVCELIVLYVLAGLLFLIALLLLLPVSVDLSYKEDFLVTVKFLGIKVFPLKERKQAEKTDKPKSETKKVIPFTIA